MTAGVWHHALSDLIALFQLTIEYTTEMCKKRTGVNKTITKNKQLNFAVSEKKSQFFPLVFISPYYSSQ